MGFEHHTPGSQGTPLAQWPGRMIDGVSWQDGVNLKGPSHDAASTNSSCNVSALHSKSCVGTTPYRFTASTGLMPGLQE